MGEWTLNSIIVRYRRHLAAILGVMSMDVALASGLNESFSDKAGFRACLDTQPFFESKTTGKDSKKRFVDVAEIRQRCVSRAVKLVESKGTEAMASEFLREARKGGGSADYYSLIKVAVAKYSKLCNDLVAYDEIVKLYSYPGASPEVHQEMLGMAPTIKTCLKDTEFRDDFSSDAKNDKYMGKNVCKHLTKEGVLQCG